MRNRIAILGVLEVYTVAMRLTVVLLAGFFGSAAAFAAPQAVAWTTAAAPCWATTTGSCWVNFTPTGVSGTYSTLGVPWDTSGHHTNQLVGTGSTGTGITCIWTKISGPSITIDSPTSCTTTVNGGGAVPAGYYVMHLKATDNMGATSEVDLDVGAIGIDANGAVIYDDDGTTGNKRKIFKAMIALGYNPWGREDERDVAGAMLQIANNLYYSGQASLWSVPGQGTVSYPFAGVGFGLPGASLNGQCTIGAATCAIHNSERLSLSSLPTWIQIGNSADGGTLFRVCSTSATTGNATLTFCYDGRGMSAPATFTGTGQIIPDQTWPDATVVGEYRIQGSGTLFATDSQRNLCPAGVPGPPGPVAYSTGTVALNHSVNPTVAVGTGTTFTSDMVGQMLRVTGATHSGGTSFTFWRQITAFTDTTHITMDHAYPSDADDLSGLSFKIVGQRVISLQFQDTSYTPPASYYGLQFLFGCESETAAFGGGAHDLPAFNATTQSGMTFSYINSLGANGAFGPNFYGTGLALQSFALRSGYQPAQTAAYNIDDYWIRDPQNCSGYCIGGENYNFTGSFLGGVADSLFNPSTQVSFTDIRPWAASAVSLFNTIHATCNVGADTRDQSADQLWLTEAALFDPDPTYKASWLTALGSMGSGAGVLGRDQLCKQPDNSFANNALAGQTAYVPIVHFTNGSAIGTVSMSSPFQDLTHIGTGNENLCWGGASGTITVANGSASATLASGSLGAAGGSLTGTSYDIVITDTTSSPHYVGFFDFTFSGSAVTFAALWPGASGTFSFLIVGKDTYQNSGGITAIGPDPASSTTNLQWSEGWACTQGGIAGASPTTQITLNRPWDDAVTGGSLHATGDYYFYASVGYGVGVAGYYFQPYQLGMKTYTMQALAKYSSDATVKAGYQAIVPLVGQVMHDKGYAPDTKGVFYARDQLTCEPLVTPNGATKFFSSQGVACGGTGLLGYPPYFTNTEFADRVNSAEAFHGFDAYFEAQCAISAGACDAARSFVDGVYGGMYGNCDQTAPGYYCDTHFLDNSGELSDGAIGAYRWYGFFFGISMGHEWPAERLLTYSQSPPRSVPPPKFISIPGSLMAWVKHKLSARQGLPLAAAATVSIRSYR